MKWKRPSDISERLAPSSPRRNRYSILPPSRMRDESGFFSLVGAFVGSVVGGFAKDKLSRSLSLGTLQGEITELQTQVASLFSTVRKIASTLRKALKHILGDIIKLRFVHLWRDYVALKDKLKKWFKKHFGWLLELRKRFDEWFRRVVVPILNLLHRIRAILQIFRILHLKFATKLDGLLGRLEAKIIKNTLVLRKKINEIASILELVLDPAIFIRRSVLIESIRASLRQAMAALGIPISRKLTAAEEQWQKEDRELLKKGTVLVSGGATPQFNPAIQRILESLDREAKGYI